MSRISRAQNFEVVAKVAGHLEDLVGDVVFVGGSAAAFLITDETIVTVRPTLDVDVIVELMSLKEFYRFEKRLMKLGFQQDKNGPRCRYLIDNISVDVMPDDESILGFSNPWYRSAIETAELHSLKGFNLRVVSAALFLATKLEAYHGRGLGDYLGSHDMEDLLAVVDGRPSIVRDCFSAPDAVRSYLRDEFTALLDHDAFLNVLPGFVEQSDAAERAAVLESRLRDLVNVLSRS